MPSAPTRIAADARAATAARVARWRASKLEGLACYTVRIHDELVLEALARSGLSDEELGRRQVVAAALAELLEQWAERRLKETT